MSASRPAARGGDDFLNQFLSSLGGTPPSSGPPRSQPMMGGMGYGGPSLAHLDPLSEEYQKALEDRIRMSNIAENAQYAQEFNPELYSHITMLYIECSINGNEIQAFVDSGAQSTIMSKR